MSHPDPTYDSMDEIEMTPCDGKVMPSDLKKKFKVRVYEEFEIEAYSASGAIEIVKGKDFSNVRYSCWEIDGDQCAIER